jgi:hypothetical protein
MAEPAAEHNNNFEKTKRSHNARTRDSAQVQSRLKITHLRACAEVTINLIALLTVSKKVPTFP